MLAKPCELDLSELDRTLYVDGRYGRLELLVCSAGRPLAAVSLPCDRVVTADRLRREIAARIGWQLWEEVCAPKIGAFVPPEPGRRPAISVVVCTRDRPLSLETCLAHLSRLEYPAFEVVVVDNGSRRPEVRRIVVASGFRYVREDRVGLDWARNRGLEEARHDIIAYIDDDAFASPGWLGGLAEGFEDPAVAAVTGLVLPAELETEAQLLFEEYGGMGKGLVPRVFNRATMEARRLAAAHHCGLGTNMAFRREALERLGRFDTALDVGTPSFGAGDLDMFHRILVSGGAIAYNPAAWVRHRHRRDMAGLKRQIYSNGRAFGVYLIKIWRTRSMPRSALTRFAAGWAAGWLLARLFLRLRRKTRFPLGLIWAEIWGALHAPWAYRATYRRDQEVRAAWASEAAGAALS